MKKIILQITNLFLFLVFVLSPFNLALADGGLIPYDFDTNDEQTIYQVSQKALIVYDDGKEDLYLKTSYRGETNNFVWLVPTSGYPEIDKVSNHIFE